MTALESATLNTFHVMFVYDVLNFQVYYTISSLCEYDAGSMPGVDETGSTDTDELEYRFQKDTMKACSRYDFTITAISSDGESDQCECTDIFCTTDTGGMTLSSNPVVY